MKCLADMGQLQGTIYEEYQEVKVVQDDDGHNYVIPAELYDRWSSLSELAYQVDTKQEGQEFDEWEKASEDFEKEFNQYRTSGDLNLKLFAKVGYQNDEQF